ncbi:BofC C-terminal domain-containing protein [Metabacillus sp. RGM 3146]|uniref:BofC C-terminal domain-containing protein n=1 Tax=Metabacillus sp. RGM 3146 TaxID=3401092 RepID=UPI003B9A3178
MKLINRIVLITTCFFASFLDVPLSHAVHQNKSSEEKPLEMKVILERVYLDGETSQEQKKEKIWSMEDFWARYEDWQLLDESPSQMVFRKQMDDISPLMKANGYFGLSNEGILTIFLGKPEPSSKVIQSFFQIDVGKLESRNHSELNKGIRVGTRDHYLRVIETYRHFTAAPDKQ